MRGFRFLRLDGQIPVSKRQPLVDRFNSSQGGEDQETVFLLSSKAGGVGLNLIGERLMGLAMMIDERVPFPISFGTCSNLWL